MFLQSTLYKYELLLNYVSWIVLKLPDIVMGFALYILLTTALELIHAQRPHSMEGFLVGALFMTKGFYQLVGASLEYLFSLRAQIHSIGSLKGSLKIHTAPISKHTSL